MGIDPSIILGVKQPQFDNPVDVARQAQSLQALGYQNQNSQREMQNQQDLRNAYSQAMTAGPDGTPTLEKQKLGAALQSNPMLYQETMQKLGAQDAAANDQKLKVMADHIQTRKTGMNAVPTSDQANPQQQQSAWTNMIQELKVAGLPVDMYPQQYPGDKARNGMVSSLMSAEEKIAQQNKLTDQTTERAKANASLAEAGLPTLGGIGGSQGMTGVNMGGKGPAPAAGGAAGFTPPPKMQQKAMEDYSNAVAGSRQQDDAKRALTNIQSAQNLEEIANHAPGGDLNKLNQQQMKLAITELVKMAGGGVPSESELKEMTPDNYAQKYAGLLQQITNKSQPANAGEFIQQGIDYANGIRGLAAKNLRDRSSELADRGRPYLGEKQYGLVKKQIGEEYTRHAPADPNTKVYNGVTYKIENGHWVPQ